MIAGFRRIDAASDKGITLVELLVAMMISGILLGIVGTMFINVARVTANANATTTRNSVASNVMTEVAGVVRMAANNAVSTSVQADPAIVSATATALTVYSFVDTNSTLPAPTKVGFRFDAQGNVLEDRWASTMSNNYWVFNGTATTRNLGGPLVTSGTPLFSYLDAGGQAIVPGTGGLTLEQRAAVASIRVTVTVANSPTTGTDPIVLTNTVGMPNLKLSRTDD